MYTVVTHISLSIVSNAHTYTHTYTHAHTKKDRLALR